MERNVGGRWSLLVVVAAALGSAPAACGDDDTSTNGSQGGAGEGGQATAGGGPGGGGHGTGGAADVECSNHGSPIAVESYDGYTSVAACECEDGYVSGPHVNSNKLFSCVAIAEARIRTTCDPTPPGTPGWVDHTRHVAVTYDVYDDPSSILLEAPSDGQVWAFGNSLVGGAPMRWIDTPGGRTYGLSSFLYLYGGAVAPDGTSYVKRSGGLLQWIGQPDVPVDFVDSWQEVLQLGSPNSPSSVAAGPDGRLAVLHEGQLHLFDGADWTVAATGLMGRSAMRFDAAGQLWAAIAGGALWLVDVLGNASELAPLIDLTPEQVAVTDAGVVVVGGTASLNLWQGGTLSEVAAPEEGRLAYRGDDVLWVGATSIHQLAGNSWTVVQDALAGQVPRATASSADGSVYALYDDMTVARFDVAGQCALNVGRRFTLNAQTHPSSSALYFHDEDGLWVNVGDTWQQFGCNKPWAIARAGADETWLVSLNWGTTALRFDGRTYHPETTPVERALQVGASGPDDVWIFGADGVGHYDGQTWSLVDAPYDELLALAPGTTELHFSKPVVVSPDLALIGATAINYDNFGIPTRGALLIWDGSSWTLDAPPGVESAEKVAGSAADRLFLADGDAAMQYDGVSWQAVPIPANVDFDSFGLDALMDDGSSLWTWYGGAIRRWDDSSWTVEFDPPLAWTNDAWIVPGPAGGLIAGEQDGHVYVYTP